GQVHAPNLPTEEVFTSPHREHAEGSIRSTMPLALRGTIVEGLELRVAGGEIVEARATRGEDALRAELAIDDGARRFGEVALVDASSRVGETGVIFNNTLFDENAAAHIAWGNALPWALDDVPADQHVAAGLNQSATHTDFMVGSPEVEIDGVEPGGAAVPLLRGGIWQLEVAVRLASLALRGANCRIEGKRATGGRGASGSAWRAARHTDACQV
ncbi:MAG TPA: aminopeptidase, partial [Solirubrobacteraceae bacterium]